MKITNEACNRCGKISKVIETDNKLVGKICLSCIANAIDFNEVEDLKLLCETLRIPFNPNRFYLAQMNADTEEEALETYFEYVIRNEEVGPTPKDGRVTAFDMINEEWNKIRDYHTLLLAMPTFKDELMQRSSAKWGYNFDFSQLVKLENLYSTTIKAHSITDPMRQDAVRKAAITSVLIDDKIFSNEIKDVRELTASYQGFLKSAGLDKIEEVAADDGTIRTVADLITFLEKRDYKIESTFVEKKDIVDLTLDNILENTKLIISEKTGIDVDLRDMIEKGQELIEDEISSEVYEREALADDLYEEVERALEADLEEETSFDMDDVEFFGE